jgi:drug/metabolite transporter (DMT)-like permease
MQTPHSSPRPSPRRALEGFALATIAILVWGVTFVNTKALLDDFSALEILFLRFLLAWSALWLIWPHPLRHVPARDELLFAAAGLSGAAVYQLLENLAIHWTNASNVSILVSVCPVFAAVLSQWFLREKALTLRFFAGFAVAIAGVAMVSLDGVRTFSFRPLGDLLALLSGLSWGFYSVIVTIVNRRPYPPAAAIRRAFFWALVSMLPVVAWALLFPDPASRLSCSVDLSPAANAARFASTSNWLNLAFLGLLASAFCFVVWNAACDRLGTVRASAGIYLIPAVTLFFAHIFLGETLTPVGAFGALLTLLGVALSTRRPHS